MRTGTDRDQTLPRWDMTPYFPSLDSREWAAAQEQLGADIDRMAALYDRHGVRGGDRREPTAETVAAFEEVIATTNGVLERLRLLSAYVNAFVTTDARDETAAGVLSETQMASARVRALATRFDAWVAALGAEALIGSSPAAAEHAFVLRKAERSAAHQMSEAEEALYAELNLTGGAAWTRLHGDFTALLSAPMASPDGTVRNLAMTVLRNLAADPDPVVRRRAYEAELAAWDGAAVPCAAALNAIKGEANTVNGRRGWVGPLDPLLHANSVDRPTLDAMQAAVVAPCPTGAATCGPRPPCSTTTCRAQPRWWSTSIRGSSSRPRSSTAAGTGRCRWRTSAG